MINNLPIYMIIALISTIVIEVIAGYIFKIRRKEDFINIVLINILTNPLLTSTFFTINVKYGVLPGRIFIIFAEILIVLIEGFIYKKCNINRPYRLSLLLNLCSYLIGLIIIYLESVLL